MTDKMREAFEKEWNDYMKNLPSQNRWMFGQYYAEIKEFVAKHFWQAAHKEGVNEGLEMAKSEISFRKSLPDAIFAEQFSDGRQNAFDVSIRAIEQLQEQDHE